MARPKQKQSKPSVPREVKHTLSCQIREMIGSRGLTAYALGKEAEVDPTVIGRFLSGERDLRLATADRIALALGLRLVEVAKLKGKSRAGRSEC